MSFSKALSLGAEVQLYYVTKSQHFSILYFEGA